MNPYLAQESITIDAGKSLAWPADASFFFCESSSLPFVVTPKGGRPVTMKTGGKFKTQFTSLLFKNPNAIPVTINFYYGEGDIDFQPSQIVATYPKAVALPGNYLMNGNFVELAGSDNGHLRKNLTITNNAGVGRIDIYDSAGNWYGSVGPNTPWTKDIGGYLKIVNNSGVDILCAISEDFYG